MRRAVAHRPAARRPVSAPRSPSGGAPRRPAPGRRFTRLGLAAMLAFAATVAAGCAGDRFDVTDPLEVLDSAELITADREDELPPPDEFDDGIFTYGDRRWFFRFPAGAACEGDEILFSVRAGDTDDELVAEVRSVDAGDCDDADDFRTVVVVLAEPFEDSRFVRLDVVDRGD